MDKRIRFLYEQCKPFPAIVQISLGIKKVFPDAPHTVADDVRALLIKLAEEGFIGQEIPLKGVR